jgi:hypothetical protein
MKETEKRKDVGKSERRKKLNKFIPTKINLRKKSLE